MKAKITIEIEVELGSHPNDKHGDLKDVADIVGWTAANCGKDGLSKERKPKVLSVTCQYLESFKCEL